MLNGDIPGAGGDSAPFGYFRRSDGNRNRNRWRLPHLTAMPVTLLQMELLLGCPVVDLTALADVVQRDVGFTSQLLHLANSDRHPEDRLLRIEDCLVDLGILWLLALVRELPVSTQNAF